MSTVWTPCRPPKGIGGLARRAVMERSRFWGTLLLELRWIDAPSVGTMATDGRHLFVNEDWCREIGVEAAAGVLVHEASHVANLHFLRMENRPAARWNIAADLSINTPILRDGWDLPTDVLLDREGRFHGWTAERIDAQLAADEQKNRRQPSRPSRHAEQGPDPSESSSAPTPQGQGTASTTSCGSSPPSASGQPSAAGNGAAAPKVAPAAQWGEVRAACNDDGAVMSPSDARREASRIGHVVRRAAEAARAAGQGTAWTESLVEACRVAPAWEGMLSTFLSGSCTQTPTWSRANRRYAQSGMWLRGRRRSGGGRIAFVLDTSGSMTADELTRYAGAFAGIVEDIRPSEVALIQCDADVNHVQHLDPGDAIDRIEVRGGGGTRFQPAFDWIDKNMEPDAIVYMTDLECGETPRDPGVPTAWVTMSRSRRPPFGTLIHIG